MDEEKKFTLKVSPKARDQRRRSPRQSSPRRSSPRRQRRSAKNGKQTNRSKRWNGKKRQNRGNQNERMKQQMVADEQAYMRYMAEKGIYKYPGTPPPMNNVQENSSNEQEFIFNI